MATYSRFGSVTEAALPLGAVTLVVVGLTVAGVLPEWPGLVHAVALPPFDIAFDLRVLVTRAPSYSAFALGLTASVAARSLVLAWLLGTLGHRGAFEERLGLALRFSLFSALFGGVAAGLEFSALAALYHWYLWAGLGLLLILSVVMAAAPFEAVFEGSRSLSRGILRSATHGFHLPTVGLYLVALGVLGAAAERFDSDAGLLLVPVSALLTLVAAQRLSRAPRGARHSRQAYGFGALVALLVTLVPVAGAQTAPVPGEPAVLFLMPGVDSASGEGTLYELDPATIGFACDRVYYYSYTGVGGGAPKGEARCPIREHEPYVKEDTQRPLAELTRGFAEQIEAIRAETGNLSVLVVTHSQSAWIAWAAIAGGKVPAVSHLVMISAFPRNEVVYPPEGVQARGQVGSDVLRFLSDLSRDADISTFDPDAPLARQLMAPPGGVAGVFSQLLPSGVRAMSIAATWDAGLTPGGRSIPGAVEGGTVDTTHVALVGAPETAERITQFLAGGSPGSRSLLAKVLDAVLPAFGVPPESA